MTDHPVPLGTATPVVFREHPFASNLRTFRVEGKTVAEIVASLAMPPHVEACAHVWIDDLECERDRWEHVIPPAGCVLYVRVIPRGGGGGGKDVLRVVAMIAIAVVAWYAAPALLGYGFGAAGWSAASAAGMGGVVAGISAGVGMLGSLAINALIPPPGLTNNAQDAAEKYRLTGTRNSFAPYANIPRVFGKTRLYPVLAGRPYSEIQGNDEYLRLALCVGWGPLKITDIKIGETAITAFDGVEYEVREGWVGGESYAGGTKSADANLTLFTNTVTEASFSVALTSSTTGSTTTTVNHPATGTPGTADYVPAWDEITTTATSSPASYSTRTSTANATEISVDITFPAGLCRFNDKGGRDSRTVEFSAQYGAGASPSSWTNITWANSADEGFGTAGKITVTGADVSSVRVSGRFKPPSAGQYTVRIRRTTGDGDTRTSDAAYWTALRSIVPTYPVLQKGLCLIALRIKATGQLNGVPDTINCVAESYLPVYSGGAWSYQTTSNPAWAACDLLRRRGGDTYIADSRIDLTAFAAWATACATTAPNASEPYWTFNGVIEGGSVFEALRLIAATARAQYTVRDGKHSIVRDVQQTVPVQHITPRNSWGYSGGKRFIDYPHALRVIFTNASLGWQQDERIVYDDGYTSSNATKFETLELKGCTSATQAWREGRYHIAAGRLRPEEHSVMMDIEALRCNVGDLVQFAHDAISIGIQTSRCAVNSGGGTFTLEDECYIQSGNSYAIRYRSSATGATTLVTVTGATGYTKVLTVASGSGPVAGDLVMFGLSSKVTSPMIVRRIEPAGDLAAKVYLVDAQDGVYSADTGTIPAFQSYITSTAGVNDSGEIVTAPDAPTIDSARSDYTTLLVNGDGTVVYRIAVAIAPPSSGVRLVDYYELQWREFNGGNWQTARVEKDAPTWVGGVAVVGMSYEVRARAVTLAGTPGPWSPSRYLTASGVTDAPTSPTNFAASSIAGGVHLQWTNPADKTFDLIDIYEGSTNVLANATKLDTIRGAVYDRLNLTPASGARYYWIYALDTSGNKSAAVGPVSATASSATPVVTATGDNLNANNATFSGHVIAVNGIAVVGAYTRGHTLAIITPATGGVDSITSYDTYGSGTGTLVTALNNVAAGKIIAICSYDATTIDSALVTALAGFGSSNTTTYTTGDKRTSHVFIGQKGLSAGQAYEKISTAATASGVVTVAGYFSSGGLVVNGAAGSGASVLSLTSTAQAFTYDGNGTAAPASQTITFTANLQNLTGTATFACTAYNASNASLGDITLGGSTNSRTLTQAGFATYANTAYVVVTATLSGYSDTMTVVKLQAGTNGTNGTNGQNAVVGFLTNENVTLAADNSGTVASFSTATGTFKVYDGLTDKTVSGSVTYSVASQTNCTVSINSSGVYSASALAADIGSATLRAIYNGVTIDKIFTLSKSKAGANGTNGTNGSNGAAGTRGSRTIYDQNVNYTSSYGAANYKTQATSLIATATAGSTPTTPIKGDEVNFSNGTDYVYVLVNDGTYGTNGNNSWAPPGMVIDGSLLVTGSVTAAKINSNNLSIKDGSGNVILSASQALGGTYIANGAITAAKIGTAEVGTLKLAGNAVTIPVAIQSTTDYTSSPSPLQVQVPLGYLDSNGTSWQNASAVIMFSVIAEAVDQSINGWGTYATQTVQVQIYRAAAGYAFYSMLFDETFIVPRENFVTYSSSGDSGNPGVINNFHAAAVTLSGMIKDTPPVDDPAYGVYNNGFNDYYRMAVTLNGAKIKHRSLVVIGVKR